MRKRNLWKREEVNRLRILINQQSNPELMEIFNCDRATLASVIAKYRIKRNPDFVKELMSKTGEQSKNWKGGNRKKDIMKHKATQRKKFPERFAAREAVARAIKSGNIIKPTICEDCGEEVKLKRDMHFHHTEDYEEKNWFTGVWVCRKCHRARHSGTH